jgi:multiple antibiotic resistance protein
MDLISAIVLLIIVTDPLGNLPMVITCLEGTRRPQYFVTREVFLATLVLILSLFLGPGVLRLLSLSQEALRLAGGIVLFLIAIKMIFPADTGWLGLKVGEEPILFPLGVWVVAIVVAMIVSLVVFSFAPILHRVAGNRALAAFQRLMGMLLTVIAVQMLITAIKEIFLTPAGGG